MSATTIWFERAYTNFVARDVSIVFVGGLLICAVEYALMGNILIPEGWSLRTFAFIAASYFVGLGVVGLAEGSRIINTGLPGPGPEDRFFSKLLEKRGERAVLRIERDIFRRGSALSVAASALFGVLVLIIG